ncbi:KN motif and ankyrin repeat domain-containing protein 1-like isoform X2 [Limulus polyphemus]|uniref:KN motif and ankyrin repeat domain-containing protein 1-like isoform X2 n=1 Tax=Limulus polyphemus TaxID=6850 RepID=A0ABM1SCS4_LIMPO|nr:KN motif and ankyrin repeat domain-containing protein 1-like isoform X2 [Limulus polyphemus]
MEQQPESKTVSSKKKEMENTKNYGGIRRSATLPAPRSNIEAKLKGGSSCQCCPYGYHIDVDFVRYCEALYNSSYLDQLKQLKKDKRKERKSMEAYLNRLEAATRITGKKHSSKSQKIDSTPQQAPPPDLLATNDALRDAVLDFEETLLNTQSPNSSTENTSLKPSRKATLPVDLLVNAPAALVLSDSSSTTDLSPVTPTHPSPKFSKNTTENILKPNVEDSTLPLPLGEFRTRSDSVSSVSSQSTISSFGIHIPELSPVSTASQQMADTMASLNTATTQSPITSPGGATIPKPVLTNIRHQMATSLQRMRELEEQVKALPILQVKLSVLKEEKRLLMLQLKAKSKKLDCGSIGDENRYTVERSKSDGEEEEQGGKITFSRHQDQTDKSPHMKHKTYGSLTLQSSGLESGSDDLSSSSMTALLNASIPRRKHLVINDVQQKSFSDQEGICNRSLIYSNIRNMKNAGTNCLVLTRDVGVGHVPEKVRSVGIGDENICVSLQQVCIKCNRREEKRSSSGSSSSSEVSENELEIKKDKKYSSRPRTLSCIRCRERFNKIFQTRGTNTDLYNKLHQFKLEKLTCDVQEQVSVAPQIQPCLKCEEKRIQKFQSVAVGDSVPYHTTSENSCSSMLIISHGVNTETAAQQNIGTCTELKMADILTQQELGPKKLFMKHQATNCVPAVTTSEGIQVSPPTVKTRDVCMQAVFIDIRHVCIQVDTTLKKDRGVGTGRVNNIVCDKCCNIETQSIGVGSYNILDAACLRCSNLQVQSTGVGSNSILETWCERCRNTDTRTVGCGSFSVFESFCDYCQLRQTETVGIGDSDVNCVLCDHCANLKVKDASVGNNDIIQKHSVGVNTSTDSDLLRLSRATSLNSVRLCDKCNATIQSVAQDVVEKNISPTTGSQPPVHSSRIPRPTVSTAADSQLVTLKLSPQLKSKTYTEQGNSVIKVHKESSSHDSSFQNPYARLSGGRKSPIKQSSEKEMKTKILRDKMKVGKPSGESESDTTESSDSESSSNVEDSSYEAVAGNIRSSSPSNVNKPRTMIFEPINPNRHEKSEPTKEMMAACKVLNDYLGRPEKKNEKKVKSSLVLIQQEWFKVSSQKNANPHVVEDYLDTFESFSNLLLSRVVNLTDHNGNTAMHYAVSHGNFDVVSVLLDSKVCDVSKQNKNGQTALMLAVSHKRVETVKMLVEVGAEVNLQDNDGSTALMCAAEHGHMELVKLLLSHPDCDPYLTDSDGSTALSIAMEAGHRDVGLLIYASMNFSRGSSPYSSLKGRRRSSASSRSTPPSRTPPVSRTPPPPSPACSRKSSSSMP